MIKKILKKKALPIVAAPVELRYVAAMNMEPGVKYINVMCTAVLELKGVQPWDGVETGIEGVRLSKVTCIAHHILGDAYESVLYGTMAVISDQPALEEKIMHGFNVAQGRVKETVKIKAAARPPKLDEDGNPVVKKPRGEVDPISGCSAGSQGHVLGMIMIKNKCSITNRGICIAEMTACLEKDYGLDNKKAKALASSWYSTLWIRKPQYYQKVWK